MRQDFIPSPGVSYLFGIKSLTRFLIVSKPTTPHHHNNKMSFYGNNNNNNNNGGRFHNRYVVPVSLGTTAAP